jgi:hypothetical protein
MIACAEPTHHWQYPRTATITSNISATSPTATVWIEDYHAPYVVVSYGYEGSANSGPANPSFELETERHRRWRLSLEAIVRHRRAARRVRLRVVSQWQRPISVARACSQAERWRVSP